MATDLARKLSMKEGQRVAIINAPAGYLADLGSLPAGVGPATRLDRAYDFVQLFVHDRAELEAWGPEAERAVKDDGLLWISYPKKSSGVKTDLTRDTGWETMHRLGWEAVSLIAIDDIWSALRFRPSRSDSQPPHGHPTRQPQTTTGIPSDGTPSR